MRARLLQVRRVQARRRAAFTLVEIMVVVVIIGLLAAAVVPQLIGNVDRAAVGRAKQDVQQIENSLNLYRLDNFRYPSTSEGLEALVTNPGEAIAPNWRQVLKRVPRDPWDQPYHYASPGQHGDFDVFTYGADRQEGGEGVNADIGNWEL